MKRMVCNISHVNRYNGHQVIGEVMKFHVLGSTSNRHVCLLVLDRNGILGYIILFSTPRFICRILDDLVVIIIW